MPPARFARTPRFTLPALLALALGIGATSATFSIVRGVMLKPLPYTQPERIVVVWENNQQRNRPRNVISAANWLEWRARNRSFTELGIAGPARLTLTVDGRPEEIAGLVASSHLFPVLGVRPALGRGYTEAEDIDGSDQVLVITHEFWQARLGGRTDVLGSTITADGQPRVVIGVMAPGFSLMGQTASFLMPYGWTLEQLRSAPGRGSSFGLARLRDGVSFEQASDDMRTIAAALEPGGPGRNAGWSVTLVPIHEQMIDQIRPALQVLSGAVALVLLIACVNVANLLLARSTVREQEIGLRAALGAKRSRLVRQMLSESVLLSLMGAAGGLVLALAFHRGLLALVADRIPIPRLDQVALDLPVLGFTLAVAFGSALLFGVVPALLASRSPNEALRDGGRHGGSVRSRRTLGTLVVVEIAVSLVLLAGAGLLIRSFVRLQARGSRLPRRGPDHRAGPGALVAIQGSPPIVGVLHRGAVAHRADSRRHGPGRGELLAVHRPRHRHQLLARGSARTRRRRRGDHGGAARHTQLVPDHGHPAAGRQGRDRR